MDLYPLVLVKLWKLPFVAGLQLCMLHTLAHRNPTREILPCLPLTYKERRPGEAKHLAGEIKSESDWSLINVAVRTWVWESDSITCPNHHSASLQISCLPGLFRKQFFSSSTPGKILIASAWQVSASWGLHSRTYSMNQKLHPTIPPAQLLEGWGHWQDTG